MKFFLRKTNNYIFLLICTCLYQAFPSQAHEEEELRSGTVRIADNIAIHISSEDNNADMIPEIEELPNGGVRKTYTVTHSGASYISLHFANFDLPLNCTMEINDGAGEQSTVMTGRGRQQLGTFWGHHVEGEMMQLQLLCQDKNTEPEYLIDEYAAGYPVEKSRNLLRGEHYIPRDLKKCGSDDKKNAICYSSSHPTEYTKARAVARLIIFGSAGCTGFLVGNSNMLLTNEHCISSTYAAQNTDYQFMVESTQCQSNNFAGNEKRTFDGSSLLAVSSSKDYALIQLQGDPASIYGSLELDNRLPATREVIYIPQHPGRRDKELGIFDSASNDPNGRCNVESTSSQRNCGSDGTFSDVSYTCDTEGGSSGSPVISAQSGKVVALHHCGGKNCRGNLGVPMVQIYPEIADIIGASSEPTSVPTVSFEPSSVPTVSPSGFPTISTVPSTTVYPTGIPSLQPSDICVPLASRCTCRVRHGKQTGKYVKCVRKQLKNTGCDLSDTLALVNCPVKPKPTPETTLSPTLQPSTPPTVAPSISTAPSTITYASGEPSFQPLDICVPLASKCKCQVNKFGKQTGKYAQCVRKRLKKTRCNFRDTLALMNCPVSIIV
jgi:hypothetical protein